MMKECPYQIDKKVILLWDATLKGLLGYSHSMWYVYLIDLIRYYK